MSEEQAAYDAPRLRNCREVTNLFALYVASEGTIRVLPVLFVGEDADTGVPVALVASSDGIVPAEDLDLELVSIYRGDNPQTAQAMHASLTQMAQQRAEALRLAATPPPPHVPASLSQPIRSRRRRPRRRAPSAEE